MACKNLTNSSKEVFDLTWYQAALKSWKEKPHPELGIEFCSRTDPPMRLAGITGMHKLVDDTLVSRNTAIATPNAYRRIDDEQFVLRLAWRGCEQMKVKEREVKTKRELRKFAPNDQRVVYQSLDCPSTQQKPRWSEHATIKSWFKIQ